MGIDLLTAAQRDEYNDAIDSIFQTFKRPFLLFVQAQAATIDTSSSFSIFGQHDQNVLQPPVIPQGTVVQGCIVYGQGQPWEYIEPGSRGNYQQNKIRESFGTVKIKVDIVGYELMKNCLHVTLDGFQFTMVSTPRPHGLFTPKVYTFTLQKQD